MKHLLSLIFSFPICTILCAQVKYYPLRITKDITFDGLLKEQLWQQTPVVTGFIQADPVAGNAPSEKTECRFVYNDEYLYMGVKVFDSEPSKIVSNSMERDFVPGYDDGFALILDTYHDKSNGLVFAGNPVAARGDEEISEDGNFENTSFNTFWDLKTHRDSTGYEMEFRIPFSSLRFQTGDTVIMGFRLVRNVVRRNEWDIYPPTNPTTFNIWSKLSLADEIVFTQLKSKKPFYIAPYLTTSYFTRNTLNQAQTNYEKYNQWMTQKNYSSNKTLDKILSNIGVDMKYGITKNFTLDLTLNTDFAQVEADNYIVNLSRFDINLPEKRTFFLESQHFLESPVNDYASIFNSRSIGIQDEQLVPIIAGARLTGKSNGWSVGALDMQTAQIAESFIPANNFSVVRLRKDLGKKGSYLGGVVTNKISTSDHSISNHVAGIDYFHRVNEVWYGRAQFALSKDKEEKISSGNFEGSFYIAQDKKVGFTNRLNMEAVGKHFNPALGFLPDNDYGLARLQNSYAWDMNKHGSLNYFTVSNLFSYKWFLKQGTEETFSESPSLNLLFKQGASITVAPYFQKDHIVEPWYFSEEIRIPVSTYPMYAAELMANSNTTKAYTASGFIKFGDFYGGRIWLLNPSSHFIFSKHFTLDLTYQYTHIKFPDSYSQHNDPVYTSHLLSAKLGYFLSAKLNLKLLTQYDSENRQFGTNLRFRYNPREGTDLYFVLNQNLNMNSNSSNLSPHPPTLDNQSVIIKFVRTFSL